MSQERAENLDDDKLGGDFPPEDPLGADDYGTTAAEERWDEPLDERIAREEPDTLAPPDEGLDLVEPDQGTATDTEAQAIAVDVTDTETGALSVDDLVAGDPDMRDVATELEGARPAEEAAVHIVDEDQI